MADAPPTPPEGGTPPAPPANTFTQEQVDKIVEQRLARERQKFADYDDMKAKAGQFDQLEESKKTSEQKLLERIEAAEKRAADSEKAVEAAKVDALRARVAANRNLTDAQAARLQGTTLEELEADATEVFGEPPSTEEPPKPGIVRQPASALKGGSNPTQEPEVDVQKAFDSIEI